MLMGLRLNRPIKIESHEENFLRGLFHYYTNIVSLQRNGLMSKVIVC